MLVVSSVRMVPMKARNADPWTIATRWPDRSYVGSSGPSLATAPQSTTTPSTFEVKQTVFKNACTRSAPYRT